MADKKLCAEASCNHIYVPDKGEGRCPKCGSEGVWIDNTVLGRHRNVFIGKITEKVKGEIKWEE